MYRKEKTGVELHVGKVIVLGNDGLRVLLKKRRRAAYLLCVKKYWTDAWLHQQSPERGVIT